MSVQSKGGCTKLAIFTAFVIACSSPDTVAATDPLDHWSWRNPLPTGSVLNQVTFGADRYVAVGASGAVVTSPDGIQWQEQRSGTGSDLLCVAYAKDRFIAGGYGGTVLTSPDGTNWVTHSLGADEPVSGITCDGETFVAVTFAGNAFTSVDGDVWSAPVPVTTRFLNGVAFGAGNFVAVGSLGLLFMSPDGLNWTSRDSGTTRSLMTVGFLNGTFLAAGTQGTILTSASGSEWTPRISGTTAELRGVTHGNGTFVCVSHDPSEAVLVSSNVVEWSKPSTGNIGPFDSVTYGSGGFVAVGGDYFPAIAASASGVAWTNRIQLTVAIEYSPGYFGAPNLRGLAFENNLLAVLGSRQVHTSQNGTHWSSHPTAATRELSALAYGDGAWVAVGETIVSSTNLTNWKQTNVNPVIDQHIVNLNDVTFSDGRFVAVGQRGVILTSTTGGRSWDWQKYEWQTNGLQDWTLYGVASGAARFVAVGPSTLVFISGDGIDWELRDTPAPKSLLSVTFGGGRFVAVGFDGTIVTSPDGLVWGLQNSETTADLYDVAYGGGVFLAVGDSGLLPSEGSIFSSSDGTNWVRRLGVLPGLKNAVYADGRFLVVGNYGAILQSAPLFPVALRFGELTRLANGTARVRIESKPGDSFTLQATGDFETWQDLYFVTNTTGQIQLEDPQASSLNRRFYRAKTVTP